MSGAVPPVHEPRPGRPVIAAPLAVWEYVFALERRVDELTELVRRFREWDDLPGRGDGPYWIREADRLLGFPSGKERP